MIYPTLHYFVGSIKAGTGEGNIVAWKGWVKGKGGSWGDLLGGKRPSQKLWIISDGKLFENFLHSKFSIKHPDFGDLNTNQRHEI